MPASYEKKGYMNENYHFFHLNDSVGKETDFHFHDFDKIVILISGGVNYTLEHETFSLKPWTVLAVPHHTIHKVTVDKEVPYERIIIYFDRMYMKSLMPAFHILSSFDMAQQTGGYLLKPSEKECDRLKYLLEQMEAFQKDEDFGSQEYKDALMVQILITLGRMNCVGCKQSPPRYDGKIQIVLSYINEHLSEDLSVEKLADLIHLSKSYFMHLFKEQTGETVYATISQKRLLYAARLIREGMPVNNAVVECGFGDYTTFYRSFKAAFGISPSKLKTL
ncbi:MAG: AraC family transcriptional regulator [Lachnospiraceae bacterium]|nr:AraC family transcriptional regulator [Lachnospiraceae bacterium]